MCSSSLNMVSYFSTFLYSLRWQLKGMYMHFPLPEWSIGGFIYSLSPFLGTFPQCWAEGRFPSSLLPYWIKLVARNPPPVASQLFWNAFRCLLICPWILIPYVCVQNMAMFIVLLELFPFSHLSLNTGAKKTLQTERQLQLSVPQTCFMFKLLNDYRSKHKDLV